MSLSQSGGCLPERSLLGDQVVEYLRRAMEAGRWVGELPSEAVLCRELQVSRVTLRKAIAQLVLERVVSPGGRGCHHRICIKSDVSCAAAGRNIRVLTPFPLSSMGAIHHVALENLSARASSAEYRVEIAHHPSAFKGNQPELFERLGALPDTAAWLLFYSTEPMQRWFASSRYPSVVVGRPHAGIQLPSIYPDTEAAARHAAGLFCARGHRELVYLMAEFTSLGDRLGSEAFYNQGRQLGANTRVVTCASDVTSVRLAISTLMSSSPAPTAFFSACPEHCLTVLCHLQAAGIRVPDDVALIAGWDDFSLDYTVPSLARYRIDGAIMGQKICSRLLDVIRHGAGKVRMTRLIPEFIPGGTLDNLVNEDV